MTRDIGKVFQSRTIILLFPFIILFVYRLLHIGNVINEPHMWRQCDTFFYSHEFYKSGINLLSPSVCWMGGYKTLVLEFPAVSAIIALFFHVFTDQIYVSRIVCLVLYAGSVVYLYLLIRSLFYSRLAYIISLTYFCLPLGLYYSTAVIIDFAEMLFVFAAFYYFMQWLKKEALIDLILVCIFASLALLNKAPYAVIIIFPAIYEIYRRNKIRLFLKHFVVFLLPVILFSLWQIHAQNLNSKSPDWYFIPGYFKFTDMSSWYFGNITSRLDTSNWITMISRFTECCTSYAGLLLFIPGLFISLPSGYNKKIFGLFSAGTIAYLLIFFNLNLIHDYYQIPFLCIASFYIGVAFDRFTIHIREVKFRSICVIAILIFLTNCIWFTQRWFYKINKLKQTSSAVIRNNSGENSLVIVSMPDTDPRDPTILAPSLRCGWSVSSKDLSAELIEELKKEGAEFLLIISNAGEESKSGFRLIEERQFENVSLIRLYSLQ